MNSQCVSIIVPTFNRAYIIKNTIESVRAQTHTDWELLIVDDGSTDNTESVVSDFQDSRIRYIRQKNAGQSVARNTGLEAATGDFVAFLDSDNELDPEYLAAALAEFSDHPEKLCFIPRGNRLLELYENRVLVESRNEPSFPPDDTKDVAKDMYMRRFIPDMTGFMHAICLRDEGVRFDPTLRRMEDWDYMLLIANKHPQAFMYCPKVLYTYHQRYGGDGIVSNTQYGEWADTFEYIYRKHEHDALMQGQSWYPERVEKWRKKQQEYEVGTIPPPHLYQFRK